MVPVFVMSKSALLAGQSELSNEGASFNGFKQMCHSYKSHQHRYRRFVDSRSFDNRKHLTGLRWKAKFTSTRWRHDDGKEYYHILLVPRRESVVGVTRRADVRVLGY